MKPTKTFGKYCFELFDVDFDVDGQLRSSRLMQLLQNAAGRHVDGFGLSWHELDKKQLFWVLSKIKYCRHCDITSAVKRVELYTWPQKPNKYFYERLFELYDADSGKLLVSALSQWMLVDKVSRKAVPANTVDGLVEADFAEQRVDLATDFVRVRIGDNFCVVDTFDVKRSHLDFNKHVNNTNYVTFVEDAVGGGVGNYVEIVYHKEITIGQEVQISCLQQDGVLQAVGTVDGTTCFTLYSK